MQHVCFLFLSFIKWLLRVMSQNPGIQSFWRHVSVEAEGLRANVCNKWARWSVIMWRWTVHVVSVPPKDYCAHCLCLWSLVNCCWYCLPPSLCSSIDLLSLVTHAHTGSPTELAHCVSCVDINLLFAAWSASRCRRAEPQSRCRSDREREEWLQNKRLC